MAEFSIFPLDKGESLSEYVARAVKIVKDSGLAYHFGPMGTTVEGDWDEVMGVIGDCHKELEDDCERISLTVRIDYRKKGGARISRKVASVEERLGD
jgi:uncharacterized protein (TIGR00106 family)